MTKQAKSGTTEKTLKYCYEQLGGVEEVADLIGRAGATIYTYADPENLKMQLPVKYTHIIDAEMKAQFGETPFFNLAQRKLSAVAGSHTGCLRSVTLQTVTALGKLTTDIEAAIAPTGPGGKRLTGNEALQLLDDVEQMERQLDRVKSTINHYTNPPALREAV